MVTVSRKAAFDILMAIEKNNSYGNLELKKKLPKYSLSDRDKGLVTELVYGVLQYLNTLDWTLNTLLKKPVEKMDIPEKNILRLGAYQILYLDKIPDSAACNESVKLAKKVTHRGAVGMVNGVLRNLVRNKDNLPWPDKEKDVAAYLALKHAHPLFLVQRWLLRFSPEEVESLLKANNKRPSSSLRVNTLRVMPAELITILEEKGFTAVEGILPEVLVIKEGKGDITNLEAFKEGLFTLQGESSALAAHILAPTAEERVIDMCSAPGGKTTHLAQKMADTGEIIAGDIYPHRVNLINASCKRLGIKNTRSVVWDATQLPKEFIGQVDKVLLDAPCSGLGVIHRKPDLKWQKTKEDFASMATLQSKLLIEGSKALKKGGIILYCVCTNEPEETDNVIESFLIKASNFSSLPLQHKVPSCIEGIFTKHGLHLYPHLSNTDGFYFTLLKKLNAKDS